MSDETKFDELALAAKRRAQRIAREDEAIEARHGSYAEVPARDRSQSDRLVAMIEAQLREENGGRAKVVSLASAPRRRWIAPVTSALVLAASVALWLRASSVDPTSIDAPLPAYHLVSQGGLAATRGSAPTEAAAEVITLTAGQDVVLVARPSEEVAGDVQARVIVRTAGGDRAWPGSVELGAGGTVRLRGAMRDLAPTGVDTFEIVVLVGRASSLARALAHATPSELTDSDGVHVMRVRVVRAP
jgi:hypothetical protein